MVTIIITLLQPWSTEKHLKTHSVLILEADEQQQQRTTSSSFAVNQDWRRVKEKDQAVFFFIFNCIKKRKRISACGPICIWTGTAGNLPCANSEYYSINQRCAFSLLVLFFLKKMFLGIQKVKLYRSLSEMSNHSQGQTDTVTHVIFNWLDSHD